MAYEVAVARDKVLHDFEVTYHHLHSAFNVEM